MNVNAVATWSRAQVNASNCRLTLVHDIDRESVPACVDDRFTNPCHIGKLNIRAEPSVEITINVNVLDVNDNSVRSTLQCMRADETRQCFSCGLRGYWMHPYEMLTGAFACAV